METFKLDLTKLTPVAEADRIKGNWYVVADELKGGCQIVQWSTKNSALSYLGVIRDGYTWVYWFAIPPGLPGFPKAELPDEFELKLGAWAFNINGDWTRLATSLNKDTVRFRRHKINLPPISIPSGTKSEQVAELKRLLDLLC